MTDVLQGPSGNYYDKFNSQNPVTRWIMRGFKNCFLELYALTQTQTILEMGCGEGHMLDLMMQRKGIVLHGLDVDIPVLIDATTRCPQAHLTMTDAHYLAYPSKVFDLVVACEVLEHVRQPEKVLIEAARVSSRYAIFSVPREPLWRVLNVVRGRYLPDLGNTPGHIQHWSTNKFIELVSQHFNVLQVRQPLPWTMLLAEVKS
jgi:ubiquinone/menaquinone biosynthesis C-methylase UbiE